MNYYNGYTPQERNKKLSAMKKQYPDRSHPSFGKHCHICGNPNTPAMPHSEDYSEPFLWERPAVYAVCKTCHGRIHKRFNSPFAWQAYKLHLRRGGYGSDLKVPRICRQISKLAKALAAGQPFPLEELRHKAPTDRWWENISTDPAILTAAQARKR